jgi:5,10-methylenetetrahydromethanopterin reductase
MTLPIRLGVSSDGSESPEALLSLATTADAAGVGNMWLACHLFLREPIACAAATLAATRRLRIVLMAMSPYTVHPVYATMAAATLDEFFPGRVQLCFGMGAPRDLEAAGVVTEQPLRTLREALELARELLSGQTVNFQGQRFKVFGRRLAVGPRPIPLWLAASGPQTLELAGERADGVIISAGTSPAFIGWALDHVRTGEKRAGRAVKKAALVLCSVSEDERVSNDRLRRRLGYVLRGAHHARNLELAGSKLDQTELSQAFAKEDWNSFDALVTDDVVRRHCASGTPAQVAAMMGAYHKAGLDELVAYGMQGSEQTAQVLAVMSPQSARESDIAIRR